MNYRNWSRYYLFAAILMSVLYLLTVIVSDHYVNAVVTLISVVVGAVAFVGLNEHSRRKPAGQRLGFLIGAVIALGVVSTVALCVAQFAESPQQVSRALAESDIRMLSNAYMVAMMVYLFTAPLYLLFEVVLFFRIRSKWPGGKDLMQVYFVITGLLVIVVGIGIGVTNDIGTGLDRFLSIAYILYYFVYYFIASRYCVRRALSRQPAAKQ